MIYQIINLVIAMDRNASVFRLSLWIAEESHDFIRLRDLTDFFASLNIFGCSLRFIESGECLDLAVVESSWFAICCKPDVCWIQTV